MDGDMRVKTDKDEQSSGEEREDANIEDEEFSFESDFVTFLRLGIICFFQRRRMMTS